MSYNNDNYIVTTYDDPYEYYWEQINRSVNAITRKEKIKKIYIDHFNEMLSKAAEEMHVNIKSKKMLTQLCYKACQAVLFEIVLTSGKPPYVAYALEYFDYAPTIFDLGENPRSVNKDMSAYYNQLLIRLESTLTKECNSYLLNNIDSKNLNNILDLETLRNDLKRIVTTFYAYNPTLKESTNHIPELQSEVTRIFSVLSKEFDKKTMLNKSKFENSQKF